MRMHEANKQIGIVFVCPLALARREPLSAAGCHGVASVATAADESVAASRRQRKRSLPSSTTVGTTSAHCDRVDKFF